MTNRKGGSQEAYDWILSVDDDGFTGDSLGASQPRWSGNVADLPKPPRQTHDKEQTA